MGLFSGRRPHRERREVILPPAFVESKFDQVDLSRAEQSLQAVAVWASTDLLASLVSEMPFDVLRGLGVDRERLRTPPHLQDPGADGQGAEDWLYQLVMSWLLRGNGFGMVRARDRRGDYATAIELLHPDHVSGRLIDGEPKFAFDGRDIPKRDLFHSRAYPLPGVVLGLSPGGAPRHHDRPGHRRDQVWGAVVPGRRAPGRHADQLRDGDDAHAGAGGQTAVPGGAARLPRARRAREGLGVQADPGGPGRVAVLGDAPLHRRRVRPHLRPRRRRGPGLRVGRLHDVLQRREPGHAPARVRAQPLVAAG